MIEATQLPFGITHTEYKLHNGRFYLLEFAARGGGGNIPSHIVPLKSGIEVTSLLVRMAMGEPVQELTPINTGRAVVLEYFEVAPGRVKAVSGIDDIRSLPGVVDAAIAFRPGDILVPPSNGGVRAGHFVA
jgi:hypothetical protein